MNSVTEMFDRAEALQNTAKALRGLRVVDGYALEHLYSEVKAERRRRNKVALEKRVAAVLAKRYGDELWGKSIEELSQLENEVRAELKTQVDVLDSKKVINYPYIEIGLKSAEQISEESEGELSPYDASRYEGWYWAEFVADGQVLNGGSDFPEKLEAIEEALEYAATLDEAPPFFIRN